MPFPLPRNYLVWIQSTSQYFLKSNISYLGDSEQHMCIPGCYKIKSCETWQQLSEYNRIRQKILSNETKPLSINCTGTFFIIMTTRTSDIPVSPISVPPWLDITQPSLEDESERAIKWPVMDCMPHESIYLCLTGW
jgi:hypothetical protein